MKNIEIEAFSIIGIAVRTTNKNGHGIKDIGDLWQRFMSENIFLSIPNKIDNAIHTLYTDYESDHNGPYTTIIGCKVSDLNGIPEGMVGKKFKGGKYLKISAKGDLSAGLIANEWMKIWKSDLNRVYTADFEIYGEKAQNPTDAEVDIFIATR